MHTISTFLFGAANSASRALSYRLVKDYFAETPGVEFREDALPFGLSPSLRVSFPGYHFSVMYIDDESVGESLAYVQKTTSSSLPANELIAELRTTFGADAALEFDHLTVAMYDFLEALPGSVVYDDNHQSIVSSRL